MRLKKIAFFGFKSFADRTEVHLDKGVTCVVGPNGCGKSNISDAIRWVLGERSAKMLRGSKMEDVIFNGTDYRKPLSYAEVSLTIENSDRGLPIDYNEVTITRRLHRSGESEYLINKTTVRLKDVQDLILDTGIGSNSYSMIEQGRIDYILNADPDKRRFLIEEAAGISKYKVKKEEALRKLERTEQNILRLNDIIQEVHKNIQYAERQAKKAEKFKKQHDYLKDLETRKGFYDLALLRQDKNSLQGKHTKEQAELDEFEKQRLERQTTLMDQEENLNKALERQSEEEQKSYRLVSQKEKNDQQLRFHQEKRVEFAKRRGEIQQEQTQLTERLEKEQAELSEKSKELAAGEQEVNEIQSILDADEVSLREAESNLEQVKKVLEQSKMEAFQAASEMTRVKNEYHRNLAFIESSDRQKDKMDVNLERFATEREEWETKDANYDSQLQEVQNKVLQLEARCRDAENTCAHLEEQLKSQQEKKENIQKQIHEKLSRLDVLKELDLSSGINKEKLLQDVPHLEGSLVHNLRELIKVESGYEWALEAALGSFTESVVAENPQAAGELFKYLRGQKTSGIGILVHSIEGFLPQESDLERPQSDLVRCALMDVVQITPGYENVLTPFLKNLYVVDSVDENSMNALLTLSQRYRLVTPEGIFLGPGGQVFFRLGLSQGQNVFQRENEIELLEKEVSQLRHEFELNRSEHDNLINENKLKKESLDALQREAVELKIQKESLESHSKGLKDRLSSSHKEAQLVMADILELQTQKTEVLENKERLESQLKEFELKETQQRQYEETMLKDIQEKEAVRDEAMKKVAERRARYDHIQDQIRLVRESVQYLEESASQGKQRVESLAEELGRIGTKEVELGEWDEKLNQEQTALDQTISEVNLQLEMIKQEKAQLQEAIRNLEEAIQKIVERQKEIQDFIHESEMKAMDLEYQEKAICERMDQSYQVNMRELKAEDFPWEDRDVEAVNAELEKLRDKVKSMGTVNLLAIEEYEELKERYDFMVGQRTDLENARAELLEAIRKINRTTKSLFEETFAAVQKHFKEYYNTLFGGGEARLFLLDEAHPLDSGIDIMVRPPGKKNQHISLLSGGEKAMTAIALLFALFTIKPSPFCVLDEVDAPLDEANIDRFLTVLKTFLSLSQFIIITHNRKTIAMGDSLYGVTMEEAGVSKIVSVKVGAIDEDDQKDSSASEEVTPGTTVPV